MEPDSTDLSITIRRLRPALLFHDYPRIKGRKVSMTSAPSVFLSLPFKVGPLARLNETRPIIRMFPVDAFQHSQLHLP